ncbi:Putative sensory transduction regulator [Corynebacterium pollutisoli]|uniref:Putative sensory transduction regulator n=1 Tax=Corynebacterium pollutisoli TaxID=1610489 RepID=A0A1X7I7G6_9CORY|nr:YbjN domain-containing protein [Corynebacterium pollutisoli]SMG09848.1 Putative sensory transduction regulator [Corynebacterium pollutisoli]
MVTLTEVYVAAESFGFHCYVGADRLVFPWHDHIVIAYLDERNAQALVFDTELRNTIGMEHTGDLARTITAWNHERLGPTVSLRVGDEAAVSLHARSSLLSGAGLTPEQLADFVRLSMETARLAVDHLIEDLPDLAMPESEDNVALRRKQDTAALNGPLPRDRHVGVNKLDDDVVRLRDIDHRRSQDDIDPGAPDEEYSASMSTDHDWDTPDGADEDTPVDVSLDRVREALSALGIEKTHGDEDVIIAWINDVLFGFFLDNGPSYLIKGHWDPGLDPDSDFLRMFLLCNDWNESSTTTKAFCHEDAEGLQVRVEFTAPVREGMTDLQLEHNTAVAINQVLHAIDEISTDATGESAVVWPA